MQEQFYADIHMDEGQKIVATIDGNKIQHYVVGSTEEIIPFLKKFPEYNSYHSVGSYQGLKVGKRFAISKDLHYKKGPKKGELIETAIPDDACIGAKAFGFDLDVGDTPEKYDSLEDAYADLARATEEGFIPEARWVMYSGGGLQFTYVLEEPLREELWTARFQQLRSHISQHLKIDRTVGSHPYRLLRSPCTPNWKYEEPVDPVILNEKPGPLLSLEYLDTLEPAKPVKKVTKERVDDVSLNCDQPVALKQVVKACAAMKHQAKTQGISTSYPVWFATGNICAHTFEFRKGFHKLSQEHPDYDKEELDDKFDEIINNAAHGPMGCEHFGDVTDEESPCYGCWANKAGFTNPISATRHLGKKPLPTPEVRKELLDEIAEIEDDEEIGEGNNWGIPEHHLPEDCIIQEGIITDSKGDVCPVFWVKPIQYNEDKSEGNVPVSSDRKNWFTIPARKLAMPGQLVAELLNEGIHSNNDKQTMMYVRQASMNDGRTVESSKFGWDPEFTSAFLPTGAVGEIPIQPSEDLLRLKTKWGKQSGTLEGWLDAVKIYEKPGQQAYLMTLLASLSSPLLAYHNLEKGVVMSLTGQGGTGKTTALKVASSIWGAPLSTISSMSSTFTATRIYLGLCGNLPMVLDEITQMPAEDLKQFALEISQGLGRERSNKDAGLAHSETWQLNCLTTSNVSVHSKLAELVDVGSADMNRVIEIPVVQSEHVSVQQGNDLLEGVRKNHGHIGALFMEQILSKDIEKERKIFSKMSKSLWDKEALKGTDRFAASLLASCYWAHKRIKEIVPKFPGDPDEQFHWMRLQLHQNNRYIKDVLTVRIPDPDDFVLDYLAESLVLSEMNKEKGYPTQGTSMKGYVYERGDWIIVTKPVLDSWCKRHQLKSTTVLARWGQEGRLKNMGPEDGQYRWSGKLADGLLIEGKKQYPTVTMIHKGKDYEDGRADTGRTGPTAAGAISFNDYKDRIRK